MIHATAALPAPTLQQKEQRMKLSLAGWSLHRMFRDEQHPLRLLDFPGFVRDEFGLDAVELNSPFFESRDPQYISQLRKSAQQARVKLLNIAVDESGDLAAESPSIRLDGINNYSRWIAVAREVGCAAIRANSGGKNIVDRAAAVENCIESFHQLITAGREQGVAILMENHGGISADADTIVHIMKELGKSHPAGSFGTLPDFGNWPEGVDRYESIRKIMPFAGAVHAKVKEIDQNLDHPAFDLARCVRIARDAGYRGYLGIEYEGPGDEVEGVRLAVRKLQPMV
jgi:sugar phosphate isomerase/epimerase